MEVLLQCTDGSRILTCEMDYECQRFSSRIVCRVFLLYSFMRGIKRKKVPHENSGNSPLN